MSRTAKAAAIKPEEFTNQAYYCLFAPDGTWQPSTLADDYATCIAFIQMLSEKKIGLPFLKLAEMGFEILPVSLSMTVTGDAETAFQAGKATL